MIEVKPALELTCVSKSSLCLKRSPGPFGSPRNGNNKAGGKGSYFNGFENDDDEDMGDTKPYIKTEDGVPRPTQRRNRVDVKEEPNQVSGPTHGTGPDPDCEILEVYDKVLIKTEPIIKTEPKIENWGLITT